MGVKNSRLNTTRKVDKEPFWGILSTFLTSGLSDQLGKLEQRGTTRKDFHLPPTKRTHWTEALEKEWSEEPVGKSTKTKARSTSIWWVSASARNCTSSLVVTQATLPVGALPCSRVSMSCFLVIWPVFHQVASSFGNMATTGGLYNVGCALFLPQVGGPVLSPVPEATLGSGLSWAVFWPNRSTNCRSLDNKFPFDPVSNSKTKAFSWAKREFSSRAKVTFLSVGPEPTFKLDFNWSAVDPLPFPFLLFFKPLASQETHPSELFQEKVLGPDVLSDC